MGIDIAPFPAFLATMNLSLMNVKELDNYPMIIQSDFSDIKSRSVFRHLYVNRSETVEVNRISGKTYELKMPDFDACVGNPPYIRQELIEDKDKWEGLAKREFDIRKINKQSDLFVYYLMHTAAFLKDGGRLGYVISSSWLDTIFGGGLQKFVLDNFKIISVIDNQVKRSFETASVNTIILILEKCKDKAEREKNLIKFVRIYKDYEHFIGRNDNKDRLKNVTDFVNKIESINKLTQTKDYFIAVRKQRDLEEESTYDGIYTNGNWGAKYLRSSPIYNKIIEMAGGGQIITRKKFCVCEIRN